MRTTTTRAQFRRASLAAAATVCLAVSSLPAAAAPDMQQVTAYGNVTVAEDSVHKWGPWEQFEAPSAGRRERTDVPRGARDPYRPLPQQAAPNLVGFAIFSLRETPSEVPPEETSEPEMATAAAAGDSLELPARLEVKTPVSRLGKDALLLDVFALDGDEALAFGPLPPKAGEPGIYESADGTAAVGLFDVPGSGMDKSAQLKQVALLQYLNGGGILAVGYVGSPTGAADLAALRNSRATASYTGTDSDGNAWVKRAFFGTGTWTATVNGGVDVVEDGQVQRIGYEAGGTIKGARFTSTSLTSRDEGASVSGTVQGTYLGRNAAGAIGVADVTKSHGETSVRSLTVFALPKTGN